MRSQLLIQTIASVGEADAACVMRSRTMPGHSTDRAGVSSTADVTSPAATPHPNMLVSVMVIPSGSPTARRPRARLHAPESPTSSTRFGRSAGTRGRPRRATTASASARSSALGGPHASRDPSAPGPSPAWLGTGAATVSATNVASTAATDRPHRLAVTSRTRPPLPAGHAGCASG